MKIKNKTGSPYHLIDKDANKVTLPAFGTVDIEPHPMHEAHYKALGHFEITESDKKDGTDALRSEYFELAGKQAGKRWSESRLLSEIERLGKNTDE